MRMVIENLALKEQIDQLEIYCDYGIDQNGQQDPEGCPAVIKLGERKQHQDACDFAPVLGFSFYLLQNFFFSKPINLNSK